ncbi:hypothetical protein [Sulfurimonas sp. CS5]|uniref:hypothetical protein n=1 Tax=Sulfurimonas sp. CS5 TaxID=3391145 RepID=UPI0039EA2FFD
MGQARPKARAKRSGGSNAVRPWLTQLFWNMTLACGTTQRFLACGNTQRFLACGNTQRFLACGNTQRFLACGNILACVSSKEIITHTSFHLNKTLLMKSQC